MALTWIGAFVLAASTAIAEPADHPDGAELPPDGQSLIENGEATAVQNGKGRMGRLAIDHDLFSQVLRYETDASVKNPFEAAINIDAGPGVTKGDALLIAFYARAARSVEETGDGRMIVRLDDRVSKKEFLAERIKVGSRWKPYFLPLQAPESAGENHLRLSLRVGYPSQTLEFANVRLINYRQTLRVSDLPETEISYHGRAPDAAWRKAAAERIERYRKGRVAITVEDADGKPVKGAAVTVTMTRHAFGFGSAVDAKTFRKNPEYRSKVFELFNEVVFENDLKWDSFGHVDRDYLSEMMDQFKERGIAVRGHNVIWPAFKRFPPEIRKLAGDKDAMRAAVDTRIRDVVGFTRGRLVDWDVLNEPYTQKDLQQMLGDDEMAAWFRTTREVDPAARLYINDYNIIAAGGEDIAHQNHYFNTIQRIDKDGGKIDGIGFQGHFDRDLTPIPKVYEILDRFASLGKEMKITEFDIETTQRDVQADYTRDLMTIAFSHPSVKSVLIWGFWEGRHWCPDAALFARDWTIRPNGEAWEKLVFGDWWTAEQQLRSDAKGSASFNGFLGTYSYVVKVGATERRGSFNMTEPHDRKVPTKVLIKLPQDPATTSQND